jgi:hypothetical protein
MVAPLEMHAFRFLTASNQVPKVFTLHGMLEGLGTRLSGTPRPPQSYGATWLP